MNRIYDLHVHSTASDGTLKPSQLVDLAAKSGVLCLALTDHDTTLGLVEAHAAASAIGLKLISGVEISTTWERQVIHIVGLGIDTGNITLANGLKGITAKREERALEIGNRLEKCGISGAYQGARALAAGGAIARPHFARYLVNEGVVNDIQTAFKKYLIRNRAAYVSGSWAGFGEAISWIREAGGQAVVAHPARYTMSRTKLRRMLHEFQQLGGEALEVVSGAHSLEENRTMARHARDLDLAASAGSDYHGPDKPWSFLGRLPPLPEGVRPIWSDWS